MAGDHALAALVGQMTRSEFVAYARLTGTLISNIRKAGVPLRNGKEDPHNRSEPMEKPEINQRLLQLAGVEAY